MSLEYEQSLATALANAKKLPLTHFATSVGQHWPDVGKPPDKPQDLNFINETLRGLIDKEIYKHINNYTAKLQERQSEVENVNSVKPSSSFNVNEGTAGEGREGLAGCV